MNAEKEVQVVHRSEYQTPSYWIDRVDLTFELDPQNTVVRSKLELRRNLDSAEQKLVLDGEQLQLRSIELDGEPLPTDRFRVIGDKLEIDELPDSCSLEIEVAIEPAANKELSGLYQSSGNFCTQCEAMGFRRITYFLDRPDVMSRYRVTLRAPQQTCPVLLSNGNRIEQRTLDGGRHEVVWEDPFPKPSYLFALVAGDLKCHRGTFVTRGGRNVQLEIWVEPQNIDRCEHALVSLQKAMKWDEDVFGLEYDLDIYMIVAVNDFNMGAMENKGLNIFNSKYVLASPETATDDDYLNVEAVVAHEYFHNWTGNRVTCRDWFQLTLKEGLTVFRDQQFTADQTSAAVKRIDDVTILRGRQFLEDAGPMAHPIRPESYVAMDNFYTATVYDKGAEVIRMYHTRLGANGFRRGMDLYFERHDGCAVTCDDFRAAMADANDVDLNSLERWYLQPGTPELELSERWDAAAGELTLEFKQSYPPLPDEIPGAANRGPVPIPITLGLLDAAGQEVPLRIAGGEEQGTCSTLLLEEAEQAFTFTGLDSRPLSSVLRGFSAPVRLRMERSDDELAFLMAHDTDSFNRWAAAQSLATRTILQLCAQAAAGQPLAAASLISESFGKVLHDDQLDGSFQALMLELPSEGVAGQELDVIDPDSLYAARSFLKRSLAEQYATKLQSVYAELAQDAGYRSDQESINRRRLKTTVLGYLASLDRPETTTLVADQFRRADNMTDLQAALRLLANLDGPERLEALETFYDRWKSDPLVLDKWFLVQASSRREDTLERVVELTAHPDFSIANPNRVRSLLGVFAQNLIRFHRADGAGYELLADYVLRIDPNNPQLSSRLVSQFNNYRRFDAARQAHTRTQLERIAAHPGLSDDATEIVQRALAF